MIDMIEDQISQDILIRGPIILVNLRGQSNTGLNDKKPSGLRTKWSMEESTKDQLLEGEMTKDTIVEDRTNEVNIIEFLILKI